MKTEKSLLQKPSSDPSSCDPTVIRLEVDRPRPPEYKNGLGFRV